MFFLVLFYVNTPIIYCKNYFLLYSSSISGRLRAVTSMLFSFLHFSIGDYVLTGGEIPAMVFADALSRMVPGVLSNNECFTEESHFNGLLEYPQYTKPSVWRGKEVPEVLMSGHHANIEKWRKEKSIEVTALKRPEMLEEYKKK